MLVVGLTGGIASGKSTVASYFAQLGVPIIDADRIARDLTAPGTLTLREIKQHFGDDLVDAKGALDRRRLRDIVFTDLEKKQWLEQLLHPRIQQEIIRQIARLKSPYCIVVIPLLVETGPYKFLDRIVVVDADEKTQIERLIARDQLTPAQAQQALSIQATREARLAQAHDIVRNFPPQDLASIKQTVQKLHQCYLNLSKST